MYKFSSAFSHTQNRFSVSAYLSFITVTAACINLYYQNVIPNPYTKWYHKSYHIIVWVLMEIVYSIFIGMIFSKTAIKIVGIGLQCRRDKSADACLSRCCAACACGTKARRGLRRRRPVIKMFVRWFAFFESTEVDATYHLSTRAKWCG
jgi:hypothetical protein